MNSDANESTADPFAHVQSATRQHLIEHGCGAYTFEDGLALIRLAQERQPKRVLELGTGLGYTACCLAYGSPDSRVDTIEGDREHVELAREQIEKCDLGERIFVHQGEFDTVLKTLQPGYDLAFFDGFEPTLETVMQMRELLVEGGLLICGNLQLSSGIEATQLATELADASHWKACDPIENGCTVVLVKQS
jgi:predicted O-methyltransferase YrrM